MTTFERRAERVARGVNRRAFLRRTGTTLFGLSAGLAAGGLRGSKAFAVGGSQDGPCPNPDRGCGCAPIYNNSQRRYCTTANDSYCDGSQCSGACRRNREAWGSTGCWCTTDCCYGSGAYSGHWRCCDCVCPGNLYCGCRAFIVTCSGRNANTGIEIPIFGETDSPALTNIVEQVVGLSISKACC
jgi:hypothetical protein